MKQCQKCWYIRKPTDTAPDYACPQCGAVYAKVAAAEQTRRSGEPGPRLRRPDRSWHLVTAHLIYFLYVLPLFTFLPAQLIARQMAELDSDDWLESHFQWQVHVWERFNRFFWVIGVAGFVALLAAVVMFFAKRELKEPAEMAWAVAQVLVVATVVLFLALLARVFKGWFLLFRRRAVG